MYSRAESKCEQKTVERRLMVVDPSRPERGVFTASFVIPTECACAVAKFEDAYTMQPSTTFGPSRERDDESDDDIGEEGGAGVAIVYCQ